MKASLKFREEQKPLMRAKVPLSILGLPFQSAIAAGSSKDLTLHLSTLFDSGPSLRLSYRPNDSSNPFSLLIRTGIAHFGSPISSPMLMTAQFNLLAGGSPSFSLHFKPSLGDFSFKKSQSSSSSSSMFHNPLKSAAAAEEEEDESALVGSAISKTVSGLEVMATTAVPVFRCAAVRFRWGLRVPAEGMKVAAFREAPFMVLDKIGIGIEHVDGGDPSNLKEEGSLGNKDLDCFCLKRQFEVLERENGLMKKGIEDLRNQFKSFSSSGEFGRRFKAPELAALDGATAEDTAAA